MSLEEDDSGLKYEVARIGLVSDAKELGRENVLGSIEVGMEASKKVYKVAET